MASVVIFGAGKIGRGFAGELFEAAGWGVTFVDSDRSLVDALGSAGRYTVKLFTGPADKRERIVRGAKALHAEDTGAIDTAMSGVTLAVMALFPAAFAGAAAHLAREIEKRATAGDTRCLDVILCANVMNPAGTVQTILDGQLSERGRAWARERLGLVQSLVIRIAVEPDAAMKAADPLVVMTNGFVPMTLDRAAFKGEPPSIAGIEMAEQFHAEEVRKLYTYNMLHAVYAYVGQRAGCTTVAECIANPAVAQAGLGALEESGRALSAEFGFTAEQMKAWNERVVANLSNPILADTVARLGAGPARKLAREDRLVGPALLCRKHGIYPFWLSRAIAGALLFDEGGAGSVVRETARTRGVGAALLEFAALERERELVALVAEHFEELRSVAPEVVNPARLALVRTAYEKGFHYEKKFKGCAQCTLLAMFDVTGKRDEPLFQAASGLSGGMAICGEGSCGGYTGGILLMGSYAGRRLSLLDTGDKDAQYKSYEMAQKLHDRFIATYGAVTCREIHQQIFGTSYCLRTKEVRDAFEAAGAHTDKCTNVIAAASAWCARILLDEGMLKVS